jgi:hypothetical protein
MGALSTDALILCLPDVVCYRWRKSPYYCKVVVGPGAHLCRLLEVWVLGVGMSTLGAQTSLYAEDRGIQVPMALEHGNIVGTQCCDTLSLSS